LQGDCLTVRDAASIWNVLFEFCIFLLFVREYTSQKFKNPTSASYRLSTPADIQIAVAFLFLSLFTYN